MLNNTSSSKDISVQVIKKPNRYSISNMIISCIDLIMPYIHKGEKVYTKSIFLMYIPRIIYLAIIILVLFIPYMNIENISPTSKTHMHLYSSLKLFYVFVLFCGAIFSAIKLSKLMRNGSESISSGSVFTKINSDVHPVIVQNEEGKKVDTNNAGNNQDRIENDVVKKKNIPFEIAVLISLTMMIPYLYDILSLLIILGISKAIYISSCNGAKLSEWGVLQLPVAILTSVGLIGLIISFILYKKQKNNKNNNNNNKKIPGILMMCSSLTFIICTMFLTSIENIIANNISYWLLQSNGRNPNTECVSEEDECNNNDEWKKAANLILSIILGLFILAIFIIQISPYTIKLNITIRDKIDEILKLLINKLIIS